MNGEGWHHEVRAICDGCGRAYTDNGIVRHVAKCRRSVLTVEGAAPVWMLTGVVKHQTAWNEWRTSNPDAPVDLSGADLCDVDLRAVNLIGANLIGANFIGADMRGAYLSDADMTEANLCNARLDGALMAGAVLRDAELRRASLNGVDLTNADMTNADMDGADLARSTLAGTVGVVHDKVVSALIGGYQCNALLSFRDFDLWEQGAHGVAIRLGGLAVPARYREYARDTTDGFAGQRLAFADAMETLRRARMKAGGWLCGNGKVYER